MARRTPGRVQMTCSTTGNGPYTLANPSPALTGKRTIAQAVTDGSLVDGDQILYAIVDPTAAGNGKLIEVGLGTINTTTLVLTVVSVYQKSEALTSGGGWGAGTRDVLISPPGGQSTAFLDLENHFTQNIYVEKTDPSYKMMVGGVTRAEVLQSGSGLYLFYYNAAGAIKGVILLTDTVVPKWSPDGVTYKDFAILNAGTINDAFESGKALWWKNTTAPLGWTKSTSDNDAALRVVSGTPGASGGSLALSSANTATHALSIAELAPHDHSVNFAFTTRTGGGGEDSLISEDFHMQTIATTGSVGSGTGHSHGLALKYVDGLIAVKN